MRGKQFGVHAARAHGGLAAAQGIEIEGPDIFDTRHDRGVRGFQRVGVQYAADGRQVDEQVGLNRIDEQAGEVVVVAELEFVDGHGVVLVDHRDDTPVQQFAERITDIEEPRAVLEVIAGQQNLRRQNAPFGKGVVVQMHEPPLPYRGGGLLAAQSHGGGFAGQFFERCPSGGHGPGRHQHHAGALRRGGGQRGHQGVQLLDIQMPGRLRQRARTDFDDHGPCACDGAAHIRFSDGQHALPSRSRIS